MYLLDFLIVERLYLFFFFFFNDTATTEIYTLSLHDALPIFDLLANAEAGESFVRTFAYMSGPAYGVLLDASSPGWTRRVRGTDDLATLVMRALAVQPATDATAAATRYGAADIPGPQ